VSTLVFVHRSRRLGALTHVVLEPCNNCSDSPHRIRTVTASWELKLLHIIGRESAVASSLRTVLLVQIDNGLEILCSFMYCGAKGLQLKGVAQRLFMTGNGFVRVAARVDSLISGTARGASSASNLALDKSRRDVRLR
jgi:hypothetical protein